MPQEFDRATMADVRAKARELKRNAVFSDYEAEDIEQDLFLHLLERWPSVDTARKNWRGYVRVILRNKGRDMISERERGNHLLNRRMVSLDALLEAQEKEVLEGDWRCLEDSRPDVAAEVVFLSAREAFYDSLTPELQEVAGFLEVRNQSEVAARMGMPRSTFRKYCVRPIQAALAAVLC